jgi:hypothetical protein
VFSYNGAVPTTFQSITKDHIAVFWYSCVVSLRLLLLQADVAMLLRRAEISVSPSLSLYLSYRIIFGWPRADIVILSVMMDHPVKFKYLETTVVKTLSFFIHVMPCFHYWSCILSPSGGLIRSQHATRLGLVYLAVARERERETEPPWKETKCVCVHCLYPFHVLIQSNMFEHHKFSDWITLQVIQSTRSD